VISQAIYFAHYDKIYENEIFESDSSESEFHETELQMSN